ncbi:MAG: HAD-IIB family hydrolase [Chromatiaceae bacterium]|nr:HAD-IIB family hydrolase [Gammaproteobacteria bacterium]MCP5313502.1 HAD-IIB family hydrolase [Chromatiaceae bacterium]
MTDRLLICTDLDRTLIPNGPQSESPTGRRHFGAIATRAEVMLTYVTGRHRALVEQAITFYQLPQPDYVIGDVGTTIYEIGPRHEWIRQEQWETEIAKDWGGRRHADIKSLLIDMPGLRLQESTKQNDYKVSYYVPLHIDRQSLSKLIEARLGQHDVAARLIWSVDEPAGIGLLDVLPARASKFHAIQALMKMHGFDETNTVFCGDSGNDIEVLASPIPAVLVANSQTQVREMASMLAAETGHPERLYIAQGGFKGLNGNYSGGMLEGIAHFYPDVVEWMAFEDDGGKP